MNRCLSARLLPKDVARRDDSDASWSLRQAASPDADQTVLLRAPALGGMRAVILSALVATLSLGSALAQPLPPAPAPPPWQVQQPVPTTPVAAPGYPTASPLAQPAPTAPAATAPKAPLPPVEPGEYGYAMPSLYGPSGLLRVFGAESGPASRSAGPLARLATPTPGERG